MGATDNIISDWKYLVKRVYEKDPILAVTVWKLNPLILCGDGLLLIEKPEKVHQEKALEKEMEITGALREEFGDIRGFRFI